jgi:hypothetical protein
VAVWTLLPDPDVLSRGDKPGDPSAISTFETADARIESADHPTSSNHYSLPTLTECANQTIKQVDRAHPVAASMIGMLGPA